MPLAPECDAFRDDAFEHARTAQVRAIARRRRRKVPAQARDAAVRGQGSPTQRQGHVAEAIAGRHLEAHGLRLLARNLNCKAGEIDLVALDGAVLVFVEVRARRDAAFGGAAASVNRRKQARVIRAARFFLPMLARRHLAGRVPRCRFDVVSLESGDIRWIRDAFME